MKKPGVTLPERKWSIVALGSLGVATVVISYVLAVGLAIACLLMPFVLFVILPLESSSLLVARALLSAFGIATGLTILWSLVPRRKKLEVNGILMDMAKEKRIAGEIESIAAALDEPVPSEVYLIADANAFVVEEGGLFGAKRRIIGLGLPLLQMLTISQFRGVLAHEFAHYYAGDTRLGPWVYNARNAILRAYENLGRKSDVIRFLRRWAIVSIAFKLVMAGIRGYWSGFMRITQWISRRQEYRCDELACHVAGSKSLVEGLQGIGRCAAALGAYWRSVVQPVAAVGFQPPLASGFMEFMEAPAVARAAAEYVEKMNEAKPSPMDTHPPMHLRIERAKRYDLPAPGFQDRPLDPDEPMISLIDDLASLETALLKKLIPKLADTQLKPTTWENAGRDAFVPVWRKMVAPHSAALSGITLSSLPAIVANPLTISNEITDPPGVSLGSAKRNALALDMLRCALALSLLENGWTMVSRPGVLYFENGNNRLVPGEVIPALSAGKLSAGDWQSFCNQNGMDDWHLIRTSMPVAVESA